MDLLQTSIGHSKYSNQIRISTKPALISAKEQVAQTPKPKNTQIKKCLKRLFGLRDAHQFISWGLETSYIPLVRHKVCVSK